MRGLIAGLALVLVLIGGPSGPVGAAGCTWRLTPTPNVGNKHDVLYGVAAAGASSAWAVGDYYSGTADRTLIVGFNGKKWSISKSANVGTLHNELQAAAALTAKDAWAVGRYVPGAAAQERTLAEHWNGKSWKVVKSSNVGAFHNELDGVAAVSAASVWAVGHYDAHATVSDETLTEHWNGKTWKVVASPNVGTSHGGLVAVTNAPRTKTVWAVGHFVNGTTDQTLIERFNGKAWAIVASPNVGTGHNELDGVSAISATNVWAVGYYYDGTADRTLIEHWKGKAWSVVTSPNSGAGHNQLDGVAAVSSKSVWAVGFAYQSADRTLTEHWNGKTWSVVTSPNVGTSHNEVDAVARIPGTSRVLTAGYSYKTSDRTLVESHC